MSARSRRQVLRGGVAVGVAGLAGCLSVPGDDGAPTEGRTRHETDVSLSRAAA
jgi:hypothetical protein